MGVAHLDGGDPDPIGDEFSLGCDLDDAVVLHEFRVIGIVAEDQPQQFRIGVLAGENTGFPGEGDRGLGDLDPGGYRDPFGDGDRQRDRRICRDVPDSP